MIAIFRKTSEHHLDSNDQCYCILVILMYSIVLSFNLAIYQLTQTKIILNIFNPNLSESQLQSILNITLVLINPYLLFKSFLAVNPNKTRF